MLIITLLLLDLLKENAYAADASVYCPDNGFTDNTVTYVTGSFNSSILSTGKCVFGVSVVNFVFIIGTGKTIPLCTQTFSSPAPTCNTIFTTQNCKCDNFTGEMFYYTYRFTTNASVHEGRAIGLTTDCEDINGNYPLTVQTCDMTFPSTTTEGNTIGTTSPPSKSECRAWCIAVIVIVIILVIITVILVIIIVICKREKKRGRRFNCCYYDIRKKEACHCGFYPDDESASHNIYKFHCCSYDIRKKGACPCGFYPDDESSSNYIYKLHCCSHEKRKKGACPCGFYPDDESSSNNVHTPTPAPGGNNRTEIPTITPDAQGGRNWTELTPTTAPGGNNRTELTVQDAKEMQDRNKHLGTDNSPEREKRRKKKKKKKTFQVVDGEPVSREDKSTVNDHKAAQNDNSISVNESSHAIDNGGHRSLPMPKISHLTSVERNSTIFQSETPRKLPPLQLKQ